ncbi:MAG: GGDEF domain-containing protein [Rhodocyclaceae bacterium]
MENSKQRANLHLVDSIVAITEQRNIETLEAVLAETIFSLLHPREVVMLDLRESETIVVALFRGDDAQGLPFELKLEHCSAEVLAAFTNYLALPEKQREAELTPSLPAADGCGIFPIITRSKVEGVMIVLADHFDSADWRLASGLALIHRNFVQVLNEKDHDRLTGLRNRTLLEDQILRRLTIARRRQVKRKQHTDERRQHTGAEQNWLAMIDIDNFKTINDRFGHIYGDEVLLLIASLMHKCFRRIDQFYRYGGEEFIVLIQGVDKATAHRVLERFRKSVENFEFPQVGPVSVSIGYVEIMDQNQPTTVIGHADQALYYAKRNGRNQVAFYSELLAAGKIPAPRVGSVELF